MNCVIIMSTMHELHNNSKCYNLQNSYLPMDYSIYKETSYLVKEFRVTFNRLRLEKPSSLYKNSG